MMMIDRVRCRSCRGRTDGRPRSEVARGGRHLKGLIQRLDEFVRDHPGVAWLIGIVITMIPVQLALLLAAASSNFLFRASITAAVAAVIEWVRRSVREPLRRVREHARRFIAAVLAAAAVATMVVLAVVTVQSIDAGGTGVDETAPPGPSASFAPPSTEPPASESPTPAPPIAVNDHIGEQIATVRDELAASGVDVVEVPVLARGVPEGEIVAQDPPSGASYGDPPMIELSYAADVVASSLTSEIITIPTGDSPCFDQWNHGRNIQIGKEVHERALYWWDEFQCGINRYEVALNSPSDPDIEEVRLFAGIPTGAGISSRVSIDVDVRIDGRLERTQSVNALRPIVVALQPRDFTRVELYFRARDYPVAVAARAYSLQ